MSGATRALLGLAAGCVATLLALQLLLVRTARGQRLDDAALGSLAGDSGGGAVEATRTLLDTISTSSLALFGLGIMAIALVRRRPLLALGAGVVVLGANVTTQLLKAGLGRPLLDDGGMPLPGETPGAGSWPSGHVTVAMSLAMALVLVVPAAARWIAAATGASYAVGVGVAVILLDWHRPSDVVGAYLVTAAWTALVAAALLAAPGGGGLRPGPARGRASARTAGALLGVLGAAFAAVVGVRAAQELDVLRVVDDRTAFAAAAAACALACAALAATVTALLQGAAGPPGRPGSR